MENLSALLNQHTFTSEVNHCGTLSAAKHFGTTGQLHLLESGKVRITRKGQRELLMDRPSMVFFPTGVAHRIEPVQTNADARLISASVTFSANQSSLLVNSLPEVMYLQLTPDCAVSGTARWLLNEIQTQRFGKQAMLNRLGEMFILQILRHATEHGNLQEGTVSAINHPQMSRVINQIHQDPAYHWTLDNLASIAAMSRSKFAEQFKHLVGQTPNEYITGLRLTLAQKLLKNNKPVNYVAGEVGYEHGSALARIFKKKLGLSPRQWLQQAKRNSTAQAAI
ncbi:AraC family transcriptional regulator [Aestuariibacter sp. GS-14]|uniref:AraC family transcriptional regulator n=1 Tax=Alteromonadaceae TaxID=72275 RepID=UPI00112E33AF|nr:AraC family transcriptional regulator [Aestuariibacter sp. GS-14]TPV62228.1 AraC family transcriptional regulator [Aestuariibacter sp. GS-14]